MTITASADSYVSGVARSANYGSLSTLIANATGPMYTHLKFSVAGSNGATSATLRVYSTSSGVVRTQVYAEPNSWTETGITYSNQPTRGTSVGALSTLTAGSYSTLRLPLAGDGTYSYVLTTTATAARNMTSRESATPPQLVVSGATTTPTAPTTPTTTRHHPNHDPHGANHPNRADLADHSDEPSAERSRGECQSVTPDPTRRTGIHHWRTA